ncbi:MAG: response regulator [Desulfovibrio sp.]|nr:response regulator [Desulfovibrio sp.]
MKKILIADDVSVSREILRSMFEADYEILEAADGEEALRIIEEQKEALRLILLDIFMPKMTGFEVLERVSEDDRLTKIPVIVITAESTAQNDMKAYEFGVADVIAKPFARNVVTRRARNIIELYEQRRDIEKQLEARTEELRASQLRLEKNNEFLVNALSSVVEFRSIESGAHIVRVKEFSDIILNVWVALHPEDHFSSGDIKQMVMASTLHDIGKIGIPDEILLKPDRFTSEEFDIMKTHTTIGCAILERFKIENSDFYRYSYDICRSHHERWDGQGYPDGLVGDDIPIWAQVVSVVDVYDALVSPRVYKPPYAIPEALRMIYAGECGVFSPKILECLDVARNRIIEATKQLA